VLAPLAVIYRAVIETRLGLCRLRLLSVARLPVPVISVGNLTTGGTGKTPLVDFIVRAIAREGKRVCVLTRGYGRENSSRQVLVSDGVRLLANEREAGDEPRLLAERLLGISAVISHADRHAAGEWAMKNLGSEIFVLDDGFQHVRLARDLDIVVVDATEPWGHDHLLPWGRLREPARGLARADAVVITRADQPEMVAALRAEICRLAPGRPVFTSHMGIWGYKPLHASHTTDEARNEDNVSISGPVAAFCGIGNPASFVHSLQRAGCEPVSIINFPDHYRYKAEDIANIVKKATAAGAESLITTAKDAVKLQDFSFTLPCFVLEIELRIDDESGFLKLLNAVSASKSR
jgi:tetraacyldisaccharide 4'-kinase